MTVTIVEEARSVTEVARPITGGVDTHADTHVAAALDPVGGLLGVREFPATAAGYAGLLDWLGGFGTVALAGVEGTGSYGAGLARHLAVAGVKVVEVDRAGRQDRRGRSGRSSGKSPDIRPEMRASMGDGEVSELRCTRCGPAARRRSSRCRSALRCHRCTVRGPAARR